MITAIILAAGAARRMGRPKQLLPLGGRPLVWHAAAAACGCRSIGDVIVVTGAGGAEVAAAVACLPARLADNPAWQDGQAGSLLTGLAAVRPATTAVIFMLADQPLVTPALLDALAAAWRAGGTIAAVEAGGRLGPPVLFDLACWRADLLTLVGDSGARSLLAAHPEAVVAVPAVDERACRDVDTPDDYAEIVRLYETINGGA